MHGLPTFQNREFNYNTADGGSEGVVDSSSASSVYSTKTGSGSIRLEDASLRRKTTKDPEIASFKSFLHGNVGYKYMLSRNESIS
jgi:hypothetical protein